MIHPPRSNIHIRFSSPLFPFSISQPSPVWRFPFYMAAPSDADIILHQRVFSYVLAVLIQISGKTFSVFGKLPVEILPIRFRCPRLEIGDGLCIPLVNSHTVFLSPAVAGHPVVNRVKRPSFGHTGTGTGNFRYSEPYPTLPHPDARTGPQRYSAA